MKYYGCPESSNTGGGGSTDWADITNKPASFPAAAHAHSKASVGLGSVDNTSDLAKPISTATQAALDASVIYSQPYSGENKALQDKALQSLDLSEYPSTAAGFDSAVTAALEFNHSDIKVRTAAVISGAVTEKTTQIPLVGNGSVSGVYRKFVVPAHRNAFSFENAIVPAKHLAALAAAASPTVVFFGDSLLVDGADSFTSAHCTAGLIKEQLKKQNPQKNFTFYNRSIGGQSFTTADAIPSQLPDWYTNPAADWLSYVQALSPDAIFVGFGMNDSQLFDAAKFISVVSKINAWAKRPDIIFITTPPPAQASVFPDGNGSGYRGFAAQEGRDYNAGFVRSYAHFYGYGVIDINRAVVACRDSYDVLGGPHYTVELSANPSGAYFASVPANSFSFAGGMTGADWNEGRVLEIKVGSAAQDLVFITKSGGKFAMLGFTTATNVYTIEASAFNVPAGAFGFEVSVAADYFTFIVDDTSTSLTANKKVVFHQKCIKHGGIFNPEIHWQGEAAGPLAGIFYSSGYGIPSFKQTITDAELFGDSDNTALIKSPYGGNGVNHYSSRGIQLLVKPLMAAQHFNLLAVDKNAVGLGSVDNTSDLAKPISTATQAALDAKEPALPTGTAGQYLRGDKTLAALDKTAVGLSDVENTSFRKKRIATAILFSDYFNITMLGDFSPVSNSGGVSFAAAVVTSAMLSGRFGVTLLTSGASANTGYSYITNDSAQILLRGSELFRADVYIQSENLAASSFRFGHGAAYNDVDSTNELCLKVVAGVVTARASASGAASTATLGTLAGDTWYTLQIELNSDATSALFSVLNTSGSTVYSATISTNINKLARLSTGFAATSTTATAKGIVALDYIYVEIPTARGL